MKIEDIKIGDKVRLLGKHGVGDNYDNIEDWYDMCPSSKSVQKIKKQGFAYVRNIEGNGEIAVASVNKDDGVWLFLPEDLEPYQKFKVGDKVRVKNVPRGAISRTNLHMFDNMREYCGKELVITDFTSEHNYKTSCKFIFAEEWLELVEEKELLLPIGTKIRQIKPRFGEMIKKRVRSGHLNFIVSGEFSYNHILDIDMKQEVYRKACKILKEHYKMEDVFISEYYPFDGINIINGFKVIIQKKECEL